MNQSFLIRTGSKRRFQKRDVDQLEAKDVDNIIVVRNLNKNTQKFTYLWKPHQRKLLPIMKAASRLNINIQKTNRLLKVGILEKVRDSNDRVYVTEASLAALVNYVESPDFVSLERAAEELGMTEAAIKRKFVSTGIVKLHILRFWKQAFCPRFGEK